MQVDPMRCLSIIIVEYIGLEELQVCLESLEKYLVSIDWEVIVVSNSCYSPEVQEKLRDQSQTVKWIFNLENYGFAKAVNQGLEHCQGRYVMLLNPDARLLDDRCPLLLEYMDRNPRVGIVGPRIVGTTGRLEDSCREFMSPRRFFRRVFRRLVRGVEGPLLETRSVVQLQVVDWVSGACMVVRKDAIERVGPMDELYFLYVEDMDWCKRFWDAGFSVIYWPDMTVEHRGGRLSTKSPLKWFLNRYAWIHLKSYLQFLLKHYLPILRR